MKVVRNPKFKEKVSFNIYLKNNKKQIKDFTIRVLATIIFTFIYGIGMNWFILNSKIRTYSGGVPGIAQLVVDIVKVSGGVIPNNKYWNEHIIIGLIVFLGNIPILLLGWFGVSKKFTIFSLVSVIVQSTVLSFVKWDAFESLDPLILCMIGAILMGIGTGGTLKYGTSTGGFDIVGQFVAHRTGKTVAFVSTMINIGIATSGAFINSFNTGTNGITIPILKIIGTNQEAGYILKGFQYGAAVLSYTVLRLLITMIVIDKLHTAYHYTEVNIISNHTIELSEAIIAKLGRGVTLFDVRGGYGYNEKQMIYLIIFSHERRALLELVHEIDFHAFLTFKHVETIKGNFKKKYLA